MIAIVFALCPAWRVTANTRESRKGREISVYTHQPWLLSFFNIPGLVIPVCLYLSFPRSRSVSLTYSPVYISHSLIARVFREV